jgi:hypothetical protein
MHMIRDVSTPTDSGELLKLIRLLPADAFEPDELEVRADAEGRLVVTFPGAELPAAYTVETRFAEPLGEPRAAYGASPY